MLNKLILITILTAIIPLSAFMLINNSSHNTLLLIQIVENRNKASYLVYPGPGEKGKINYDNQPIYNLAGLNLGTKMVLGKYSKVTLMPNSLVILDDTTMKIILSPTKDEQSEWLN